MYIVNCVFERAGGISKSYRYEASSKQWFMLLKGDYVVVTKHPSSYAVAIVYSKYVSDDPEEKRLVTQHICCRVTDNFYDPKAIGGKGGIPLTFEEDDEYSDPGYVGDWDVPEF